MLRNKLFLLSAREAVGGENKLFKNILYLFKCTPDIIHIVHYTAMKSSASTTASSTSI